jgi:formate dehydrogenase major subunit
MSLLKLLFRWPLLRQLRDRTDGTGADAMSDRTLALRARTEGAEVARSVCPYCGVGCGQRVWHRDGKLVAIDGDPESPINQGTLCPKGAASHQLLTHERRLTRVLYRRPRGTRWEELDLETAMDLVAERVWESRRRSWVDEENGLRVGHTTAIAHLGGATLDNEENYLIKKLFTGGLGMVAVSNQARI